MPAGQCMAYLDCTTLSGGLKLHQADSSRRSRALVSWEACSGRFRPKAAVFPRLRGSSLVLICGKFGGGAKARSYVRIEPTPAVAPNPIAAAPWYVKGAALLVGFVAIYQVFSRLRGKGSLGELEERGLIDEDRHAKQLADDPFYNKVMKNINTVAIDELSPEQIEAARKRRMRERDTADGDIERIVLPENHPFAVKKKVSKEEEDLIKARLAVKRGLPLQDLQGTRGLPDDAFRRATQQR
eukprot:jgi/Botrbrau1/21124/Bobra.0061s0019.1